MFFSNLGQSLDRFFNRNLAEYPDARTFRRKLLLLCLFCIVLAAISWFPGIISDDTMAQYRQATGIDPFTDWHPPLMARLWQLEVMVLGTAKLWDATYILITGLGLYVFFRERPCRLSFILYLVLFWSPMFFGIMGFVDKDILLLDCIFLTIALYTSFLKTGNIPFLKRLPLFTLLVIISFLRFNAVPITAPLIVMLLIGWRATPLRAIICLPIVFLSLILTGPFNHKLLHASSEHPEVQLEIFDLAGITHFSREDIDSRTVFRNWSSSTMSEKLFACYHPFNWDRFGAWIPVSERKYHVLPDQWGVQGLVSTRLPAPLITDPRVQECFDVGNELSLSRTTLQQDWINAIKAHPGSYLHHRWRYFSLLMSEYLWKTDAAGYTPGFYSYDWFSSEKHKHILSRLYTKFINKHVPHMATSYGSTWLAASIFLFITSFACANTLQKLVNVCSFASLMYLSGYFFLGSGGMYRYILPSAYLVLAALLARYALEQPLGSSKSYKIATLCAFVVWCIF